MNKAFKKIPAHYIGHIYIFFLCEFQVLEFLWTMDD